VRSSVLISAHQCLSVLISGHQCSSTPINAHQHQSAHLWNRLAAHSNGRIFGEGGGHARLNHTCGEGGAVVSACMLGPGPTEVMRVSILPKAIAFARTPSGPHSLASVLVRPVMPACLQPDAIACKSSQRQPGAISRARPHSDALRRTRSHSFALVRTRSHSFALVHTRT
jgi:hypothetical protein